MNEQPPFTNVTPDAPPPRRRRATLWLLTLPLLACIMCAALSVYALMPLRGEIVDRLNGRMIPVTGEETPVPLPDQKVEPDGQTDPTETPPGAENNSDPTGAAYRDTLDQRLNTCTFSFHEFLILEQAAFNQPDMLNSSNWRSKAKDAASAFHDDCQAIGTLPDAPTAYAEVDQLLKKAAAEVQPATDDFSAMLDASEKGNLSMDKARSAMRHMVNFIKYTQRAEDVLSGIDEMKKI